MSYSIPEVQAAAAVLKERFSELDDKRSILRAPELSALYEHLGSMPPGEQRANLGREVNSLKQELNALVAQAGTPEIIRESIDVSAPMDINSSKPQLLSSSSGSIHPLMSEMEQILDIFYRMGFSAIESREIDDDYHMFTSLNFPADHPARDEYDTFITDEGLIAPAHTSVMQNRVLKDRKTALDQGNPIAYVIPGRVFRNEDVDARHEHTFYQLEGIYVDKGIHSGHLSSTIRAWLSSYFGRDIDIKIQPFYFPFTEPSFEFAASCIFCDQKGCNICSQTGWIELGGCGLIHPNVLREGGIDPQTYSGFAWGFGIDRLVMLKHNIEDVRHFESANLKFLRQF